MADISSYPQAIPAGDDLILGSQADEAGVHHTKTFTTQSVADLGSGGGGGGSYLSLTGGTLSGNLRIAKSFPSIELQHTAAGQSNGRSIKFLNTSGAESGSINHQVGPDGGEDPGITIETEGLYKTYFRVGQGLFEWKMQEQSTSTFEKAMWLSPKTSSSSRLTLYGGDIELDEASRGIILKSPNGTRYKLTVDNAGSLAVTAV